MFRDRLAALGEEYGKLRDLPPLWLKRFARNIRVLFSDEHAEGVTSTLDVYAGSGIEGPRLSADIVWRAVGKMLDVMQAP